MATMTFKLDKEYVDELRQLVSDVNDANLYGLSQLEERIDALERRIEKLEKRCGKIAAFSYGDNDIRIKDHERRIEKMERKLNHKGGKE